MEKRHTSWGPDAQSPVFDSIPGDFELKVDVVVVGAGIHGLTAAMRLKEEGLKVCVLERSQVASGESGHTTAHLTQVIDSGLSELISYFGKRRARSAVDGSKAAMDRIEQWVSALRISCDFMRLDAYLFTDDMKKRRALQKHYRAAKTVGLEPLWQDHLPPPYANAIGMRIHNQAQFDPLPYLYALANRIHAEGSAIYGDSPVVAIEESLSGCSVRVENGARVLADQVVLATDAPIGNKVFLYTRAHAYRTYAMAFKLKGENPVRALYWDLEDPYHYVRSFRDLLIVGGADHKVGMESDTEGCWKHVEDYARRHFDVDQVVNRWSGQVWEPVDGLPYIGRNLASRRVWVASGFAGNGMTFGTLAGMIHSDAILGRKNAWLNEFPTTRLPKLRSPSQMYEYATENADFPMCFVKDRVNAPEATSLDEVGVGEGKIVDVAGKRAAVYRDEGGTISAVSPTCTHMGCYVRFNSGEKSWDCPCHGSRFATNGRVLHGPAVKDLKPIAIDSEGARMPANKPDGEEAA